MIFIMNTKLEDFKIGGKKRIKLCITIPLIKELAYYSTDPNFKKELESYLNLIEYDEEQIYDEFLNKTYRLKNMV